MEKEYSKIDHQHPPPAEEKSNLTCASGEAIAYSTVSSSNKNDTNSGILYPPPNQQPQPSVPLKKKRNQPGHPDPGSEVIALSPRTLMATNRFVCEICNKGFQREQNLQLHRRGHNLPWKLKQRTTKEVRRKVYVCPETNCVHHDPTRALGDLTGIKKHFSRKHGEKKWKCEKCSKRYAVQSDWKAHSKTCGTKEYRCDCGTLFTRRDSFITHRAFCDALVQETERSITANNTIINPLQQAHHLNFQQLVHQPQFNNNGFPLTNYPVKKEQQSINDHIPPWLPSQPIIGPGPGPPSPSLLFQHFQQNHDHDDDHNNPNPNPSYHQYLPHFSATALLQKASQMGVKSSSCTPAGPHQGDHVPSSGLNFMASRDQFISSLACYNGNNNKAAALSVTGGTSNNSLLHDMMLMSTPPHGFEGSTFDDNITFDGILNMNHGSNKEDGNGMTRDFLGLRPLSQSDIMGLTNCLNKNNNNCNENQNQG